MKRVSTVLVYLLSILIVTGLNAQNLNVTETYSDSKNGFSLKYLKGSAVKKNKSGADIISKDKALSVNVKVYSSNEIESIADKSSESAVDTLDVLKSFLKSRGIEKELNSSMNSLPESILTSAKADSGSFVKYDLKKKNSRFVCRSMVFAKGGKIVSVSYEIAEKKGNEKYEKIAADVLRSFTFTE